MRLILQRKIIFLKPLKRLTFGKILINTGINPGVNKKEVLQRNCFNSFLKTFAIVLIKFIFTIFILLALFYCAQKVAPTGGPRDETPPEIVRSFPSPDSVEVEHLEYIEIKFSESIRQTSLLDNFWIIPELSRDFEVKWSGGDKVRFYFQDSLDDNQTYSFNLGTGISDKRNNKLNSPFQLAFSTGSSLDSGVISGKVFAEQRPKEAFVYAYALKAQNPPDSLVYQKARYYTQIDAEGSYRLNYLPMGRYRVITLVDNDFNFIYNVESDLIGIPFMDVNLDSSQNVFSKLNFYLIKEDTTAPRLRSVDTLSTTELKVLFDEPIKLVSSFELEIYDTWANQLITPLGMSHPVQSKESIDIFFESLPVKQKLELRVRGIADKQGNTQADTFVVQSFESPAKEDTTSPMIKGVTPSSGQTNVPYDSNIMLSFNSPIDTNILDTVVSIVDENNKPLAGNWDFTDLQNPIYRPDSLLKKNTKYTVSVPLNELKDLFGRPFPDTTQTSEFSTIDWANLGEISGTVSASGTGWNKAIVKASAVRGNEEYEKIEKVGQKYVLPFLPNGRYIMQATWDANENGIWDHGKTNPWIFAEPFMVKSDTVQVRKRWTTDGINFKFEF